MYHIMYAYICVYIYIYMYIYVNTCIYTYIYMYMYIYILVYVCTYMYMRVCVCIYTHAHIYTHTHTHTHTHIYIYIHRNILPTNPNKKTKLIIYYNTFKTSTLVIKNIPLPRLGFCKKNKKKNNVIYQFKCLLEDCMSDNNNIYVGLTSTTLSRRLTMHLSDTSPITQHLKKHSCITTELRKILTDNTIILEHQNNNKKLQILEALHIRNMQPTLNRINFQTGANVLKCL